MIITSLKNIGKSIGYYFIPIGVIAFICLLYLAFAIPACVNSIQGAYQAIADEVSTASFDWNEVQGILFKKFIEYNDSAKLAELFSDTNKIVDLLADVAKEAFHIDVLSDHLMGIIQNCVSEILVYVVAFIAVVLISIFLSIVVLNILLRKYLTETNIFKSILVSMLNGVLVVGLFIIIFFVSTSVNRVIAIVAFALLLPVTIIISLLEAYLFYGVHKVPFKKVFNFKNMITLLIGELITLVIGIGFISLAMLIPNMFASIIIILPLAELLICVLALNADVYTVELARKEEDQ